MTIRLISTAFAALLFTTGAQAAVSVLGGGPAEMCFQGADTGGDPADYLMYCNQALAGTLTDTDRAATYINRGVLKLATNSTDSAASDFLAGLKINDKLGEGYVDLAATEITHKKFADAIADINKGLALGTKQPYVAYYDRAMADEALGNLQGAYDDYRQALRIEPDFTLASNELKRFKVVDKPSGT
jgi:tetratricopeptide (TPR) repeat protein